MLFFQLLNETFQTTNYYEMTPTLKWLQPWNDPNPEMTPTLKWPQPWNVVQIVCDAKALHLF